MASSSRHPKAAPGPAVLQRSVDEAAAAAGPWIARLARFGYAAKGVVYILVGGLAALGAVEAGRNGAEGSRGALRTLLAQPFGTAILVVIGVGLLGFVAWRLIQAFKDPDRHGRDAKGLAIRAYYVANALVYLSLALAVIAMGLGNGGGSDEGGTRDAVATLMRQPFGRWLVGAAGAVTVGVGLGQFWRAWRLAFKKRLKRSEMSAAEEQWTTKIGRFGFAARGVTFLILGGFVITAALQADPAEAGGLEAAFRWLEQQPFGTWLLAVVALGLAAYGVFQLVLARYRRLGIG